MEAYGTARPGWPVSSAAIVAAAIFGSYFLASGQLTEGFLVIVAGLLAYSLSHEQRPYFV